MLWRNVVTWIACLQALDWDFSCSIAVLVCMLFNFKQVYTSHVPPENSEMRLISAEACRSDIDSKVTQITSWLNSINLRIAQRSATAICSALIIRSATLSWLITPLTGLLQFKNIQRNKSCSGILCTNAQYASWIVTLQPSVWKSNFLKQVRFWLCTGGSQKLSLWIVENSTGPEEQRRLWHSASEPKSERGWKLIVLPLYALADWYIKHITCFTA